MCFVSMVAESPGVEPGRVLPFSALAPRLRTSRTLSMMAKRLGAAPSVPGLESRNRAGGLPMMVPTAGLAPAHPLPGTGPSTLRVY